MSKIVILQDVNLLGSYREMSIVFETADIEMIPFIVEAVSEHNHLFCIKIVINYDITSISFKETWQGIPLVIYPDGLGNVRDLIELLPIIKKLNVKFFLNGAIKENYEAVQILSSLGIYSGIVINNSVNWDKLIDLMYYALCGRVDHAPIEPFQYTYDNYEWNKVVDYGVVYFEGAKDERDEGAKGRKGEREDWQSFFYEGTECAACAGWRICLGKYAGLENKIGCQTFATELLNMIEKLKRIR